MPKAYIGSRRPIRDQKVWGKIKLLMKQGKGVTEIAEALGVLKGTVGCIMFRLRLEDPTLPQVGELPRKKHSASIPKERKASKPRRPLPDSPPVAYGLRAAAKELGLDLDDLLGMIIRREVPSVSVVGTCRYALLPEVLEDLKAQLPPRIPSAGVLPGNNG